MKNLKNKIALKTCIGGIEWDTIFKDNLGNADRLGETFLSKTAIYIAKNCSGEKVSDGCIVNTYWHEITHALLMDIGENELSNNERFVSALAGKLVEVLSQSEFIDISNVEQLNKKEND